MDERVRVFKKEIRIIEESRGGRIEKVIGVWVNDEEVRRGKKLERNRRFEQKAKRRDGI